MQSGRTPGKRAAPKQFDDLLNSPYKKQAAIAKALAQAEGGLTAREMADKSEVSETSVRATINLMRRHKFIYISRWLTPSNAYVAVYSIGSKNDAERPLSQRAMKDSSKRVKGGTTSYEGLVEYYKDLTNALVPKRTPEETREVNNLYLNWISGGEYAHELSR